jgi:hypothetical protein
VDLVTRDDFDVAVLRRVIELNPSVLGVTDALGRIPLQVATDLEVTDEVREMLLSGTSLGGFVWCGGARGAPKHAIHCLLHDTELGSSVQEALQSMSSENDGFTLATRVNGLNFGSEDVQQCACGNGRIAFLLKDGSVVRFTVTVMAQPAETDDSSSLEPDIKELEAVTKQVDDLQKRLQARQDMVDKAKEADYGYEDEEIDTLTMITGLDREVCIETIRTIDPNVGQGRLELTMNILLGGEPLGEDGWWDGYEVGR